MTKDSQNKILPEDEWLKTLASKRIATQVVYRNADGEILILKPSYREDWLLPGGMVEANESPFEAVLREVKEELGIEPQYIRFAGIDYQPDKRSNDLSEKLDFLHIYFNGGYLSDEVIQSIKLEEGEIEDMRFVHPDNLDSSLLPPAQIARVKQMYNAQKAAGALDDGQVLSDVSPSFEASQFVKAAAGVCVVNEDGKILMVQERQPVAYKKWHLPAGTVDVGETFEQAAIREAKEESGLSVRLDRRLVSAMEYGMHVVVVFFLVTDYSGEIKIPEDEILDARWFSVDEIRAMREELRSPGEIDRILEAYERG